MQVRFIIKNNFQRRAFKYEDIITEDILGDICYKLTGQNQFTVDFDNTGYNKGRLVKLEFAGTINYISISENEVRSRNSFFQSFTSALLQYNLENNQNKRLYFYFLEPDSNIETNYFVFMYRLMKTAGTIFLNEEQYLSQIYQPFNTVTDLILNRDLNRRRNSGNASTYVSVDENSILQIFGKTYGANKYETILLTLAIRNISTSAIDLYEIQEGNLSILPQPGRSIIINSGINIITSDLILERREFEENDSLRSPTYLYNLLEKLGEKKCALCDCAIPQIIQGAHIWPVADIKRSNNSQDDKLSHAINKDNGLWLCNNHHKLFDINILAINEDGRIKYRNNIIPLHEEYLYRITSSWNIDYQFINDNFMNYLQKRNNLIDMNNYNFMGGEISV